MSTTTTRILTSMIAAIAIVVAACSAPQSQPPAASTAETPASPAADAPATAQPSPNATPAPASRATSAPASPAASAPAPPPAAAPAPPPPPPKPKVARLTAGHVITVRTTREISTKTAKTGDPFSAILEEPIKVDDWVVAGAGAKVDGRIVESDKGGRIKGKASLTIELTNLTTSDGQKVEIVTSPVASEAAANKGKNAAKIGVAAGAGAAVGAIAGGGQGAAIGALVGGGAGAALRGDAAAIPAESVVSFELRSPVTIQEKKN